ncbi:MAG: hypothetical protein AAF585_10055 [Verrucomicrobiota bacterium]
MIKFQGFAPQMTSKGLDAVFRVTGRKRDFMDHGAGGKTAMMRLLCGSCRRSIFEILLFSQID